MEQLSTWNDITTIKQRYLNLLHGMTRVDQHPRQLHNGKLKSNNPYFKNT